MPEDSPTAAEESAANKNVWEKVYERVTRQSSRLASEAEGLDEELLFRKDNDIRDLLRTKSFVDIDIKRIFRIAYG
jgi:hypothetical protein